MTDRIERRLPEILTQISIPQVPDYTDDILGLTARRRQRPGWTFPGRWLPLDIAVPRPAVAGTPWRPIIVLILLILVLAAAVVYVGTRTPRLAPFYGPAANGSLIYERQGDIYLADRELQSERILIGGDDRDIGMRWSLDGGTLFFGRIVNGRTVVMAADPDGSNVRQLSTALPHANEGVEVAPDGSRLVAISLESKPASLEVMPLDGSNTKRKLEIGDVVPVGHPQWRPPGAEEIVFLGNPGGVKSELAVYRIRSDGTGMTQLAVSPVQELEGRVARLIPFQDVALSDDGRWAAYANWEPGVVPARDCFVHLLDLDTGTDQRMTFDPRAACEGQPEFLADGRLIFERGAPGSLGQLLTAPIDGGTPSIVPGFEFDESFGDWTLAPDRLTVVWNPFEPRDGPARLIDIKTGASRDGAVHPPQVMSWQRVAP